MTSSQHAPYTLGDTRNTMVGTIRSDPAKASESVKLNLSSDCRLQSELSLALRISSTSRSCFPLYQAL